MVNKGKYTTYTDLNKCTPTNSHEQYFAIAESTRKSNNDKQIVKMWLPNYHDVADVFLKAEITKAPNATNLVGKFTVNVAFQKIDDKTIVD